MKKQSLTGIGFIITCFFVLVSSCTKDYLEKPTPPQPKVGVETDSLEASYTASAITTANASYWKGADFVLIDSVYNLSTHNLYSENGRLNLTGTYDGVNDFNSGVPTSIKLKAAYDDEYLYILAEWEDSKITIGQDDWRWNGPSDPLKSDSTNGWTSQRNDDKLALAFDIDGASSGGNSFVSVGCAASCHGSAGNFVMGPENGNVDLWTWSLALSEPAGYAFDMNAENSGAAFDAGTIWFHRNNTNPNDYRTGPAYEWDGVAQNVTRPLGGAAILDPAWYILNKTSFIGNPATGEVLYANHTKGCEGCHGIAGVGFGENGDGPPFNNEEFSRKFSRAALKTFAESDDHDGKSYFEQLSNSEADNVIAYIRGLAGVPGYYLDAPASGESLTDIETNSNVIASRINTFDSHTTYKVMFKRKLDTGNADDVKFEPLVQPTYVFGIALMDGDGKNHVGSLIHYLTFKDK